MKPDRKFVIMILILSFITILTIVSIIYAYYNEVYESNDLGEFKISNQNLENIKNLAIEKDFEGFVLCEISSRKCVTFVMEDLE